MNSIAETALKESIKAWERKRDATALNNVLLGSDSCPLCAHYVDEGCLGCPVYEATGEDQCMDTPYYYARHVRYDVLYGKATMAEWKRAAQAEIDFLKSLLPEGL